MDDLDAEVLRFKEERRQNMKEEKAEVEEALKIAQLKRPTNRAGSDDETTSVLIGSDEEENNNLNESRDSTMVAAPAARGRGRGRGSRGGATRGRGATTMGESSSRGSRDGVRRGRGKTAEETSRGGNRSIKDSFMAQSSSRTASSAASHR